MAACFGGAMAGIGGAYLSIVQTPLFVENMTAGRGWIALALVVFASWRPGRVLLGAYLFGGITIIQLHIQGFAFPFPHRFCRCCRIWRPLWCYCDFGKGLASALRGAAGVRATFKATR